MIFFALARMGFRKQLAYRAANLAGLATNAFFAFLRGSVFVALYAARDGAQVNGLGLPEALTFTGVAQAMITWVALWGWWDMIRAIKQGDIANDVQRPVSLFWNWCAQDLGRALAQTLWRAGPLMLVFGLMFPIVTPQSLSQWLAFGVAMLLAWFISFCWRFLYSLIGFWTTDAVGVGRIATYVGMMLSGFVMPVRLMPELVRDAMAFAPFASMINTPIEIFANVATGEHAACLIARQVAWAAAMLVAAHALMAAGTRKLVTVGG